MSFRQTKFYSFEKNFLIINGVRIGGFDDEGGIEYEYDSDLFEVTIGADGEATASYVANDLMAVTITLKETSDSYRILANLAASQRLIARTGTGGLLQISYKHFDPNVGDVVTTNSAIFMGRATPNKGRVAGSREFRLAIPYGALTPLFGPAAVLPIGIPPVP